MALLISGMTLAGVRMRDPSGSAQEGGAVRLAEATATALGSGFLGREHAQRAVSMHLANSGRIGSKLMQTTLS